MPADALRRAIARATADRVAAAADRSLSDPGPDRIVDVVVHVGDDVGDARDLAFDGRWRDARAARRPAGRACPSSAGRCRRALPRSGSGRCAIVLEHVDDAQALLVVIEAAGHERARARARRRGRTACGRGRGRARSPRSAPRAGAAPWRWCARSARPRACASAACGSDRRPARRTPASCASGAGTPWCG